jgi:ATP-dependent Clp protease protease subunit
MGMGTKILSIVGELDETGLKEFLEAFTKADASPGTVTVRIHSAGGSVQCGTAIYELLRTSRNPIVTIGIGEIASMAVLILMAGDVRVLTEGSTLLLHDGSVDVSNSLLKAKQVMQENIRAHEWYCEQIADRCDLPVDEILGYAAEESYLTAERALSLGLIDEVKNYRPYQHAVQRSRR